jgi:N-sulfoglucosamine sulfohydrolase
MKTILALFSLAVFALGAERPNIVFIFADDWGRYASCYAGLDGRPSPNDIVRTPNIDRVARSGVLFKNAFVPAPSCTPCRSSLLSGQYFFRTGRGAVLQGAQWDAAIPSWPLILKDAGYHIGKSHKVWSPGTPADAPFGGQQFAFDGAQFSNFSENATKLVASGEPLADAKAKVSANVRANFDAFLAARPAGTPFCYWFGPTNVHRTWVRGSGKALWGIEPDSLRGKLPKFLPDVPEVREDVADYLGEVQALDAGVGILLKRLEESGELERTIVIISGDHGMPGMPGGKCNLYDFGTRVALVAMGPGIKAGRVVDDFVNLMDLAPTFCEIGGARPGLTMTSRSFADVLRSEKSGQVDEARTWVVTGRERHVGFAREENRPYPQRALRTPDFLYVRNFKPDRWPMGTPTGITDTTLPDPGALLSQTYTAFADMDASPTKAWVVMHRNDPAWRWHYDYAFAKRPAEELFDLKSDPDQVKNVAEVPAYAEAKTRMAAQLMKILKDAGDPRVTDDGETFERSPFTDDTRPGGKQPRR